MQVLLQLGKVLGPSRRVLAADDIERFAPGDASLATLCAGGVWSPAMSIQGSRIAPLDMDFLRELVANAEWRRGIGRRQLHGGMHLLADSDVIMQALRLVMA